MGLVSSWLCLCNSAATRNIKLWLDWLFSAFDENFHVIHQTVSDIYLYANGFQYQRYYKEMTCVCIHDLSSKTVIDEFRVQDKLWLIDGFKQIVRYPDSKVHGANIGPTWGRQDPGGSMLAPWTLLSGYACSSIWYCALLLAFEIWGVNCKLK